MGVVGFGVRSREPYAGGMEFGDTGSYERIDGVVTYAVDPEHERNQSIVDLELAPRDAQGRVLFEGDLCLLVPSDPSRGSGKLFLEVPNRGTKLLPSYVHRAKRQSDGGTAIPHGDDLLLHHGYTVGWVGWQWDVYRSELLMGLTAPEAQGITGTTRIRFQPNRLLHTKLLAHRVHQPLPAADVDEAAATLRVRDWPGGEPTAIPREHWRFAREEGGEVVPDPEHVWYEAGFQPGKVYEVIYTTRRAPVAGTGLLAVRDVGSFLRYSDAADNPCAGQIERVYSFGVSQTGRFLRHLVYLGMNLDEAGRQVFDGVISHVGGARRGEFNHRYAQPSARDWPNFGYAFPFADEPMPDPDTGEIDGMLKRQRELGGVPKIFWTNSSSEYWRGDCALLHIDPTGSYDLEPAPETRIYALAGTQHARGTVPLTDTDAQYGERARYPFNTVDYSPFLRNLVLRLDQWVSEGIEPPPSVHPRIDDGTTATYRQAFEKFPKTPDLYLPDLERLRVLRRVDMGPDADKGIGSYPPKVGEAFPALVWDIDDDGNEAAPVRLPDLVHPLGSHTAWNPRHPDTGSPDLAIIFIGATHFFPRDAADREASGDPRRSIAERYPSRDAYLQLVRETARDLVRAGYVLEEDLDLVVSDAGERYDEAMKPKDRPV